MSKTSVALIVALSVAMTAVSAGAATPPRHSHHGRLLAPGVYPNELIENNAPSYGGGWVGTGQLYTRESGGVNSMSNDFGTSTLGHTNGMPVTGH